MSNFRYINQTYIESPEFRESTDGLTYRINLTDGQEVLFISEKEFFTPRRVATNLPDVIKLENVVEYSPNNIPIIKLQNGQTQLTRPQYYINSIVRDVYREYNLDTFFTELDDDLGVPEYVGTELERRQLALTTLLNLEDLAAAAQLNDFEGITEALDDIDNNFSELAGLEQTLEWRPEELTTPEEDDQLAALNFVGLTDNDAGNIPGAYIANRPSSGAATAGGVMNDVAPGDTKIVRPDGSVVVAPGDFVSTLTPQEREELGLPEIPESELPEEGSLVPDENGLVSTGDTSGDFIDPTPTIDETALIRMNGGLPLVAGQVPGIDRVNQAIEMLNEGVQQIEGSMSESMDNPESENDNCRTITVARGKRGFGVGRVRVGRSPQRTVSREDIEKRLAKVKTDIALQERNETPLLKTGSGVPTLIKTQNSSLASTLINSVSRPGVMGAVSKVVGAPVNITPTTAAIPSGYQPMQKSLILRLLYKTRDELEKLLAQGC